MKANKLPPIHPEQILGEEFILPHDRSQNTLARCFGTSAEMWTGLQADYELRPARREKANVIEHDVEPLAALELAMA